MKCYFCVLLCVLGVSAGITKREFEIVASLMQLFEYIEKERKGVHSPLIVDYHMTMGDGANYGWKDGDYFDQGYKTTLKNCHTDWKTFVQKEKDGKQVQQEPSFSVLGAPGSGNSRFLMELRHAIEQNDNILPILITFNDKCAFYARDHSSGAIWSEILSRIAFSLLGNNDKSFFTMINTLFDQNKHIFQREEMNWQLVINFLKKYFKSRNDKEYKGIVLLVDDMIFTRDAYERYYNIIKSGWGTNLSRKNFSCIFTTLNPYDCLTKLTLASGRTLTMYILPQFGSDTMGKFIRKFDDINLIHAMQMVNYVPRYLRVVLDAYYQTNIDNDECKSSTYTNCLHIPEVIYDAIVRKIGRASEKIFYMSFINQEFSHCEDDGMRKTLGQLILQGVILPYYKMNKKTQLVADDTFVPRVSLLSLLQYLQLVWYDFRKDNEKIVFDGKGSKEARSFNFYHNLKRNMLELMKKPIVNDDCFGLFQLVFEALRYNAFDFFRQKSMSLDEYFGHKLIFVRKDSVLPSIRIKFGIEKTDVLRIRDRSSTERPMHQLLHNLKTLSEPKRKDCLLSNVFWFGGSDGGDSGEGTNAQKGCDSLVVYEMAEEKGGLLCTFFQQKHLDYDEIKTSVKDMKTVFGPHDKFLYVFVGSKNMNIQHLGLNTDEQFDVCALFLDNADQRTRNDGVKYCRSTYFGPSWSVLLAHRWSHQ